MLKIYRNAFHNKNIYIDFENEDIGSLLSFRVIADKYGAPLQIMLDGKDALKRNFISQKGFKLMRTCYSCEFFPFDLRITPSHTKIKRTTKNQEFSWNYYICYKKSRFMTSAMEKFIEELRI